MLKITSFSNLKIKSLIRLREHRERVKTGLTIIEGIREVRAARDAGTELREIYFCPALFQGLEPGEGEDLLTKVKTNPIELIEVSKEVFAKIAFGDRAQGILAVGCPRIQTLTNLKMGEHALCILIDQVEKPGNLGAIVRTCDASGINALFVSDPVTDVFNPNVIRASLGTVFSVPLIIDTPENLLTYFNDRAFQIVATTPAAKQVYTAVDYRRGTVIAVGSEKDGLSDFWLNHAHDNVLIPMKGKADSLNTSVAAALVVYEALRQRSV